MSSSPNYAPYLGIQSVAAAILFAVLYAILLPVYVSRTVQNRTAMNIALVIFCAIRVASYSMRAAIAGSTTAGFNLGLITGYDVLAGVGYVSLLFSAYTLIVDRQLLLGPDADNGWFTRLFQNKRLVRLILIIAVSLGIAGGDMAYSSDPNTVHTAQQLREAGGYIFLGVTALVALQAILLAFSRLGLHTIQEGPFGARHGPFVLVPMLLLLLVREAFTAATVNNPAQAGKEKLWYPLSALPELLAVMLFAVPGLVPSKAALAHTTEEVELIDAPKGGA